MSYWCLLYLCAHRGQGRGAGTVALRDVRPLEKGCGKSRERGREREGPKEWSHIKSNRTQARLYPACLSRSLRAHRKLPTPPALTHSLIITHHTFYSHTQSHQLAESDQRGWLRPCGEWMGSGDGWLEFWCSALYCSAVSTLFIVYCLWQLWYNPNIIPSLLRTLSILCYVNSPPPPSFLSPRVSYIDVGCIRTLVRLHQQ